MTKQKLLFIPFVLAMGIVLSGCNFGKGANFETLSSPAVIDFDYQKGGVLIRTQWGAFAAPSLEDAYTGDLMYLSSFTIDYDNQPSIDYYTATNISVYKSNIPSPYLQKTNNIDIENYTLPLSLIRPFPSPYFNGKFFVVMGYKAKDKNTSINCRLLYNSEEPETNGIKNLYLQANINPDAIGSAEAMDIYAFDMNDLIYSAGRDTTMVPGINEKYIRANLYYFTKMSENNTPVYERLKDQDGRSDILISVFR